MYTEMEFAGLKMTETAGIPLYFEDRCIHSFTEYAHYDPSARPAQRRITCLETP
jgi:hypothetical protein